MADDGGGISAAGGGGGGGGDGLEEKISYFQAVTGLDDVDLCTEILSAHGWDLELAISSFTSTTSASTSIPTSNPNPPSTSTSAPVEPPGIAWKLITLPFYVVSGGVGLAASAVGLGFWIAGGVLSRSLNLLGLLPPPNAPVPASAAEAAAFVASFDCDFGGTETPSARPNFVAEGFMDALQRSQREFRLMFVYLHSPDHPDVPRFCLGCLRSDAVAAFINENFVAWGGNIRAAEGFRMSNSLKASRYPFCAVVMASTQQMIVLLAQIEGPKSPEEMLSILQRVHEECSPSLTTARLEVEERRSTMRLREEQDAAYRAALEADQSRERQRKEEQERLEREAAEVERRRKEEEEAQERAVREAAEKQAARIRRRQEKAMTLGEEPEKAPDVTQVLVRFPNGERKERRFPSSATIESLYDYVDSLDCLDADKYSLVSNFPRVSYGPEKHSMSLKEAGLHPRASLFVEIES